MTPTKQDQEKARDLVRKANGSGLSLDDLIIQATLDERERCVDAVAGADIPLACRRAAREAIRKGADHV